MKLMTTQIDPNFLTIFIICGITMRSIRVTLITGLLLCSQILAVQNVSVCQAFTTGSEDNADAITLHYPVGGEVFPYKDTIQIVWEFDSSQIVFIGVFFSLDSCGLYFLSMV